MDNETRAAFDEMRAEMRASFAKVDRWFVLAQGQHEEFRAEVRADIRELRTDVQELRTDVQELRTDVQELRTDGQRRGEDLRSLAEEFRSFRDWVTLQLVEIRDAIHQLTQRVERLERRSNLTG